MCVCVGGRAVAAEGYSKNRNSQIKLGKLGIVGDASKISWDTLFSPFYFDLKNNS